MSQDDQPMRALKDGQSGSGSVNTVVRRGGHIVRPAGPWTKAVHGVLRHLQAQGFVQVPQVVGLDPEGEVLTYLDGEAAMRPWPAPFLATGGLETLARWLKGYHLAMEGYRPEPQAVWRAPDAVSWSPGMVVRHGDLGPWNTIWRQKTLVGVIDWDLAEPGWPLHDVAQLAWYGVPLTTPERCAATGVVPGPSQRQRLESIARVHGVSIDDILRALMEVQQAEVDRTLLLGGQGVEPWTGFFKRGDVAQIRQDMAWLEAWRETASHAR